ncbi:MAG: hypothetical protein J6B16_03635 [Clostridia bacterium]|nr:hypothetical protein [Clostridia bacterium]
MTNNNIFTKSKIKTFIVMVLALIMSVSVFMVSACKKDETPETTETVYNPSYSYTDYDDPDAEISNANFKLGLADKAVTDFPVKNTTGWSVSSDSGSSSSETTSGVIKTDAAVWDNVILNLAEEDAFFDWAKAEFGATAVKTKTSIKNEVKDEDDWKDKPESEINKEVDKRFVAQFNGLIANPGVHTGANDNSVVMLANFSSTTAVEYKGVSQAISSSSSIALEKGQSAKISFWVKTDANNVKGGANLRLNTSINGNTQAQYAVKNIDTNGQWAEYTVYVKGNEYTYSTISIVLGFGMANGTTSSTKDLAYGLCYFDDVTVEVFDTVDEYTNAKQATDVEIVSTMNGSAYTGNPEAKRINAAPGKTTYFYTLSYNDWAVATYGANNFFANNNFSVTGSYVDSEDASLKFSDSNVTGTASASGFEVEMVKSAYKFDIKNNNANFEVAKNSFVSIAFNLKTNFSKYNKSGVTVYVHDINSKNETLKSAVLTVNEPNEDGQDYVVTIKNNYDEVRYFYLEVVLGTATPASQVSSSYFITGNVKLDNLKIAKGYSNKLYEDETENLDYDKISFFNSLQTTLTDSNVSYALHAGKTGDFSESTLADSYNMEVSYANSELLKTKPVASTKYFGVVPNHEYVKVDGSTSAVNTNVNAGVINTKYLDTYKTITSISNIADQFGTAGKYAFDANDKALQPLMIYNATAVSYGFIAKNTVKIEPANRALITINVRVTGDAVAYIYLVDMSNTDNKLNVITHEVNDTVNQLAVKVTADTVDKYGENGWVTVKFNVATGATAMNYRVELWNGSRDGQEKSSGYVFFNNLSTTGTFTETTTTSINKDGALLEAANTVINGNHLIDLDDAAKAIAFKRELTDKEVAYNEENPDSKITVTEKYVWLTNKDADGNTTFVYAIYNSIDPKITIPSAEEEVEDETPEEVVTEESGCKATGGTFWLQFANIALATLLILMVLFIIFKHFRKKFKKNAKVKARYNVSSRNKALSDAKKAEKAEKAAKEAATEDVAPETTEDVVPEATEATETAEEVEGNDGDETEYTYGEVLEDFGDDVVVDGQEVEIPKEDETKPE